MITVESVTKTYGSLKAVNDVSFEVAGGEIVGFVGPNGAGKSTMLKMLSTYLYPTLGRISVAGFDVVDEPLEVRRRIGYLSGDTPLYRDMRVDEFLRFIGRARGLRNADLERHFDETVDLCGVGDVLAMRVDQCSTGFRQRVGLATALIHDPPILLLDEATSALDAENERLVQQALDEAMSGRTTLVIAHRLATVLKADRIVVMDEGRVVEQGTHAELSARGGLYARLAALQFGEAA